MPTTRATDHLPENQPTRISGEDFVRQLAAALGITVDDGA